VLFRSRGGVADFLLSNLVHPFIMVFNTMWKV
jgi:hypothetical protein